MTSASKNILTVAAALHIASATVAQECDVLVFFDRAEWEAEAGPFTTIRFTEFPRGTFITNHYADLGVLFTDGNDAIFHTKSFENDGAGLDGNGRISLSFAMPQHVLAVDFPGAVRFELFDGDTLIYQSLGYGGGGVGFFVGLVSTEPFDRAILIDPVDDFVFIDDLHFGPPCPADIDGSGDVGVSDLLRILSAWGECPPKGECREDLDGNGIVDFADILIMLAAWGPCL